MGMISTRYAKTSDDKNDNQTENSEPSRRAMSIRPPAKSPKKRPARQQVDEPERSERGRRVRAPRWSRGDCRRPGEARVGVAPRTRRKCALLSAASNQHRYARAPYRRGSEPRIVLVTRFVHARVVGGGPARRVCRKAIGGSAAGPTEHPQSDAGPPVCPVERAVSRTPLLRRGQITRAAPMILAPQACRLARFCAKGRATAYPT